MTTADLIREAHTATRHSEDEILAMIRKAWPGRTEFTLTQCRLLVSRIERTAIPSSLRGVE